MSIYLDLAFFINFLFDLELMILTHLVFSKKIHFLRVFFAAFLGGMQGVLVFFPYFGILSLPPVSIFASAMITAAAICPCSKKDFASFYAVFLGASFFLAGIIDYLRAKALFGSLLILPVYLVIIKIKKEIFAKRSTVTLCYKDKKVKKPALYDSGNKLFYFGKPVIMANKRLLDDFLEEGCENMCVIPYKTIGKSGTVIGIRLDRAIINGKSFDGAVLGFFEENLKDEVILNGIMM